MAISLPHRLSSPLGKKERKEEVPSLNDKLFRMQPSKNIVTELATLKAKADTNKHMVDSGQIKNNLIDLKDSVNTVLENNKHELAKYPDIKERLEALDTDVLKSCSEIVILSHNEALYLSAQAATYISNLVDIGSKILGG
jgi:hypothetical protein